MTSITAHPRQPVIQFRSVSFERAGRRFFDALDLELGEIRRGSVTALVGVSGIGKSTFLRMIAGIEMPKAGEIKVAVDPALVSFLSQEPVIFEHLSALANAQYLLQARKLPIGAHFARLVADMRLQTILEGRTAVGSLSGGERQRLAILRALSIQPALLLLDEPCAGLDPALRGSVIESLQRAIGGSPATVLYATHHVDEIALASDRVLFFERHAIAAGPVRLVECRTAEFLAEPPTLDAARFALFPRCNVVHGQIRDDCFFVQARATADSESAAFLPNQAALVDVTDPSAMQLEIQRRGNHVWIQLNGESIAVSSPDGEVVARPNVLLLPGAIIYNGFGGFTRVLASPLLLRAG